MQSRRIFARLHLEFLHDLEEAVVHLRLGAELGLDLLQISKLKCAKISKSGG